MTIHWGVISISGNLSAGWYPLLYKKLSIKPIITLKGDHPVPFLMPAYAIFCRRVTFTAAARITFISAHAS